MALRQLEPAVLQPALCGHRLGHSGHFESCLAVQAALPPKADILRATPFRTFASNANQWVMQVSRFPFAAIVSLLGACGPSGPPSTPLFNGVQGKNYAEGTQLIQNRLTSRFPKGSSEAALKRYLEEQGLQIELNSRLPEPYAGVASVKYGGPICGSQIRVSWIANEAGKVDSVEALYSDSGCP